MTQRLTFLLVILGLFISHVFHTLAINLNCIPCCPDSDDSDSPPPPQNDPQNPQDDSDDDTDYVDKDYHLCRNRPPRGVRGWKNWAPDGGWACDQSKVDFPTVECLVADMRACGNVGDNSVFYSLGAHTGDARPFRDTLDPPGTMFNDALDTWYSKYVINTIPKFGLVSTNTGTDTLNRGLTRKDIFTARWCEAMATLATGTAYVVIKNYNGDSVANQGGRPGVFQNPIDSNRNLFKLYEFGTLQRNVCTTTPISPSLIKLCYRNHAPAILPLLNKGSYYNVVA